MTEEIKEIYSKAEYNFLRSMPDIILLGLGGSYAYGTNIQTSDLDIRGIYMNPAEEILGINPDSEQVSDSDTDTVIYSFKKIIKLLISCNPNTIELLGLRQQDYLEINEAGQLLLDNRSLFLSQKAAHTFGNYAASQLNRLINKSGRGKSEYLQNEVRSLDKALANFVGRYKRYTESGSEISAKAEKDEVYLDMRLKNLPIKNVIQMLNELVSIDRDYSKSVRNNKAIEHNKLSKHMMHLFRLYMMGIDILEKGEIFTYREKEHDLLMSIRNGDYLENDRITPNRDFENLLEYYQQRFQKAAAETKLPKEPDIDKINGLVMKINRMYL